MEHNLYFCLLFFSPSPTMDTSIAKCYPDNMLSHCTETESSSLWTRPSAIEHSLITSGILLNITLPFAIQLD